MAHTTIGSGGRKAVRLEAGAGHPPWAAPDDPRVRYRPDDDPVDVGGLPTACG